MIPKVLVIFAHRWMCTGLFFRHAFRQAGCQTWSAGPDIREVYGHDCPDEDYERPDIVLPNEPMDVEHALSRAEIFIGERPDLVVMIDQYDPVYLGGRVKPPTKFAIVCVENWNAEQHQRSQQRSADGEWYMISHDDNGRTTPPPFAVASDGKPAEWMPFACDPFVHPYLSLTRDKTAVQIGTHYQPRPQVWNALRYRLDMAPPLSDAAYGSGLQESPSTLFGKVFSYRGLAEAYNRGVVTISASNCDFLPMRIFEAFAMGALLVSDDVPAVRKACGQPYKSDEDRGLWFAHDGTVDGICDAVDRAAALSEADRRRIRFSAFAHAMLAHTYCHRAQTILERVGLRGATRLVV